jgi:hypothetical protein
VATGKRDIFLDLSRSAFILNQRDANLSKIATCFHQDKLTLSLHPLEIDATRTPVQGPFAELDPTGWSASVKVFKTSDGTVLASQTSWTVSGNTLNGSLDLNTANMALEFPASPLTTKTITAIFEVEITDGNGAKFTFQDTAFVINREYIVAGSPTALPLTSYYTAAEMDQLFVKFANNPAGATISLKSPDGTKTVDIGCNDDGSFDSNA